MRFSLTSYRFYNAKYILFATFLIRLGFGVMLSTFPEYILHAHGIKIEEFGLISTFSPLFEFLTVLFFGIYIDKYGKKRSLMLGMVIATIAMFGISLSNNPYTLIPFVSMNGIASGIVVASSLAIIIEITTVKNRGWLTGIFDSMNILGWAFGYFVGFIFLTLSTNFSLIYIFAGMLSFLGFISVYFLKFKDKNMYGEISIFKMLKKLFMNSEIVLTVIPWLIIYIFIGSFLIYLPIGVTGLKIPYWEIGITIAVGSIALIKIQTFFGSLSDRLGRLTVIFIGGIGFTGLILTLLYMRFYGLNTLAIIFIAIFGFMALAFAPSSLASLGDLAPAEMGGTTMALYSFVISGGMIIGIPATSFFYTAYGDNGLILFFSTAGIVMMLLLFLKYLISKK